MTPDPIVVQDRSFISIGSTTVAQPLNPINRKPQTLKPPSRGTVASVPVRPALRSKALQALDVALMCLDFRI